MPTRPEGSGSNVTSAIGLEETSSALRTKRSSLYTRMVIWVTGLTCLALLLGALAQAWSNSQLMQQVQTARQQYQQVQAHHNALQQLVDHFKDPFVIESEARQQLGYDRPGEHPVVIVGSNDSNGSGAHSQSKQASQSNFWQDWWNIFFGN